MEYKLYRLKWFLAKRFNFKSPVHLDLELNNNCNQSCLSCWHHQKKLPFEIKNINREMALNYLKQGSELGIKSVKFNLRGEPLLSNILIECITYAKKLKYVDIMINTNGILLTREKMLKLDEAGLTTCIVSVDSFTKKTYCKIHNCSKIEAEKLYNNLNDIRSLITQNKIKCKIKLNFHVSRYNKSDDFFLFDYGVFQDMKPIFRHTQKREGLNISLDNSNKKRKKKCPHMMRRLTILSNGSVYPCCVCYLEPDDILLLNYSNLEYKLKQLWNSDQRKKLLKDYENGDYKLSCKKCTSGDIYK